ncbi:MAG: glycosyltransferase [Eubacterium sp.]|nr:glycosyltransferase [Eubacterium sp.]
MLKSEYDCNVTVLGYSDKERPDTDNPYGFNEYEMKAIGIGRRIMAKHENRVIKLIRLLLHPAAFLYVLHRERDYRYVLKTQYKNSIRRLCKKQKFDCIVCFRNPNDTLAGAIEAETGVPIIAYELDPWESDVGGIDDNVREFQYNIEKKCAAIITTKLLYSNYLNGEYRLPKCEVYCAEFPNIIEYKANDNILFSDGKIHCVFTGQLYDDIRNPRFTIELFSKLADDGIVLDIFGNDNGCLKDIVLPDNVIYHGEVKSEKATEYLLASDIVVNIGNTLTNQLPSKILTYISMGKPILNIIKVLDCPTLKYIDKYPLALSVLENDCLTDDVVMNTKSFCEQNRNQCVDFSIIKEVYYEATPEYVGKQLYEVIKNAL